MHTNPTLGAVIATNIQNRKDLMSHFISQGRDYTRGYLYAHKHWMMKVIAFVFYRHKYGAAKDAFATFRGFTD